MFDKNITNITSKGFITITENACGRGIFTPSSLINISFTCITVALYIKSYINDKKENNEQPKTENKVNDNYKDYLCSDNLKNIKTPEQFRKKFQDTNKDDPNIVDIVINAYNRGREDVLKEIRNGEE